MSVYRTGFEADLFCRYIRQLRYGCDSTICHTPTCFTCRKRLALTAGHPIRPYNSTSARILAVHLASQDNPERGLCRNPLTDSPIQLNKHVRLTARKSISGSKKIHVNEKGAPSRKSLSTEDERSGSDPLRTSADATTTHGRSSKSNETNDEGHSVDNRKSKTTILEEYTTTDHKSFVQNMFGAVAFKMVEWLTPRNLEVLTKPEDKVSGSDADSPPLTQSTPSDGTNTPARKLEDSSDTETGPDKTNILPTTHPKTSPKFSGVLDSLDRNDEPTRNRPTDISTRKEKESKLSPSTTADTNASLKVLSNEAAQVTSSKSRRRTDSYDAHVSRGILNIPASARTTDTDSSSPLTRQSINSKPRPPRRTMIANPILHVPETASSTPSPPLSGATIEFPLPAENESSVESDVEAKKPTEKSLTESHESELSLSDEKPPQSLSSLPIEAINLICDILENDNTLEKHELHPDRLDDDSKRYPLHKVPLHRNIYSRIGYPRSLKNQWRCFVEQSLHSVLNKPDSLIKSFNGQDGEPFDTQTIWYCMLRMTRVAPSIVFNSLWVATGTLFKPPKELEWAMQSHNDGSDPDQPMSKADAARLISICFHALVAAAPLLNDPRQLANMSRIRSYGISLPGRESSTYEGARLCLQYDDAFTNELALRLARRVFSAVSTRRRFSELIQVQRDVKCDAKEQESILDIILGTFKYLDLDASPQLNFTAAERDLHEKRMPTLILDWARTVMLQDWDGRAEVPADGPFGGALETIAAICMKSFPPKLETKLTKK